MGWTVGILGLLLIAAAIFVRRRGYTFFHPFGFIASKAMEGLRPVARDRYARILDRFFQGDRFDTLWLSHADGEEGGLILTRVESQIELSVSFFPLKEPDRILAFRNQMTLWGLTEPEESHGNVGLGADHEVLTLDYRVPPDEESLRPLIDRILGYLQGPPGETIYVAAWQTYPLPQGFALRLNPSESVLDKIS